MMKSFFKKLAFVMALAMVVTLAAPAGTAAYADEAGIALQGTKEVITKVELEKDGEPVDLCFLGAPKDWKTTYKWEPSDETVITVDKAGVVTPVAAGTATVTITAGADGSYKHTVDVIVKGDETLTYEYKQVSHNTATFTFNKDVTFAVEDITLTKEFDNGYSVEWPINTFKCEKNVVTVTPYVDFADGDVYTIKIGAGDEGTTFTTKFGLVDYVEVAYESLDKKGVAYAPVDEDDDDIEVILSAKLYSNGVDVTKAAGYSTDNVYFKLLKESDDFDLDEEGILEFAKPGVAAQVIPVYVYEDAEGDEKEIEFPYEVIISMPAPKYSIVSVDKYTIVKEGTEKIDWSKAALLSIPAFDDIATDYEIAVLMTDSYGNKVVYPDKFAEISEKINNKEVLSLEDVKSEYEDAEDYEFKFMSTNDNKIFVGNDDGLLTTIGKSTAPILFSLYDEDDDDELYLVKTLAALKITITAERKIDKVTAKVNFTKLPSQVEAGNEAFRKGTVTLTVVDQYGAPYYVAPDKITVKDDYSKWDFSAGTPVVDEKKATYTYTFDGEDFVYVNEDGKTVLATDVDFDVNVDNKAKTDFTVKVAKPKLDDNVVEVKNLDLTVDSKDMKLDKADDLKGGVTTTVKLVEISNKMAVGLKDDNVTLLTAGSPLLKNDAVLQVTSKDAKVGDVFVVIYGTDGKAINAASGSGLGVVTGTNGQYEVRLAADTTTAASGSVMEYVKTGEYTVKAFEITKTYEDDKFSKFDTVEKKFTVSNSTPSVTLNKRENVNLMEESPMTIEEVVTEAFSFKFGSKDLNEEKAVITKVNYKYSEGSDRVYIYSVEFNVPLNNGDDTVYFKSGSVAVNSYVEVELTK